MFLAVGFSLQTQTLASFYIFLIKTKLKAEEKNQIKVEAIELH